MISRLYIASAAAAALMAVGAFAQKPADPAPAGTSAITVPPSNCAKPEFPGPFSDQRRFDRFNKDSKGYADCIKKYVAETKAVSDANIEAGNNAIKEFNDFIAEVDARQAAVKK
jgi:hypothetical protein